MKIVSCKINHYTSPLGYDLPNVRASWKVTDTAAKEQTAAQITVWQAGKEIYCTGKADLDSICTVLPLTLLPRTRYTWQVEVWADNGDYAKSDENWFETAKMDEPFAAKWLYSPLPEGKLPVFGKKFTVEKLPQTARLYSTALGMYQVYVNGRKVNDEYLLPGCTDYHYHIQYQTFDVKDYLHSGENELTVYVGNGWCLSRTNGWGGEKYTDRLGMLAELHLDDTLVCSDASWTVHIGPVVSSDIYDGERFAPLTEKAESLPAEVGEIPHPLQARMGLPVKVVETVPVKEVLHTKKGEWVLDFGQNMAGFVRIHTKLAKGQTLHLQVGELLQDDCFYRENLRTAKAEYFYEADGNERTLEPFFTFYGFRYALVEGIGEPDPADFIACALSSDLEQTGTVETCNEKVNKLISNAHWGQRSNYVDIPTDCPQRDERMGWTADAQVFTGTACLFTDAYSFLNKYLTDMDLEQQHNNGAVPYIVPNFGETKSCSVWGDAATVIPWTMYRYYGDPDILVRQYGSMKAWVEYIRSLDEANGGRRLWLTGFHFGDWLGLDNESGNTYKGGTDDYYVASAYYWYSTTILAKAARVLGKEDDAKHYFAMADEILAAIRAEYFTPTGRLAITTQTGYVLSLFMNLYPQGTAQRSRDALRQKLEDAQVHLKTGFVGTAYLCRVLSENGMNDYAYQLLLNEDFPGWLYCVNMGATTIWERWNSVLPDGKISGTAMNSMNHYSYGSICEWMFRNLAGLQEDEQAPGFRKAFIRPQPNKRLPAVRMQFDSPVGVYKVSWQLAEQFTLDVTVPFGAQATLTLPGHGGETQTLCAGTYHFAYDFIPDDVLPEQQSLNPAWLSDNS